MTELIRKFHYLHNIFPKHLSVFKLLFRNKIFNRTPIGRKPTLNAICHISQLIKFSVRFKCRISTNFWYLNVVVNISQLK